MSSSQQLEAAKAIADRIREEKLDIYTPLSAKSLAWSGPGMKGARMSAEKDPFDLDRLEEGDFLDEQIAARTARNPAYPELLRAALRRRQETPDSPEPDSG